MNRPIKFRVWRYEDAEFIYAEPVYGFFPSLHMDEENGNNLKERYGDIQQFTGLLDKNGKEIYEGDVLGFVASETAPAYLQQVKWDNDAAMFVVEDKDGYKSDFNHWPMDEIIGNIYENPELLQN